MREKNSRLGIITAWLAIGAAIFLTLFWHWEPGGESWGYWFFARIFSQTHKFSIIDRSPLYVFYLNLFYWLGFPWAVFVEYIVTSLIVSISLIALFRRHLGLFWASLSVILCLPFLQVSEPPVQKLALACICLATAVRSGKINRLRLSVSYALLIMAYTSRITYLVFLFVFLIWDITRIVGRKGIRYFFMKLYPRRYDWPIFLALALVVWFNFMPSPLRWNNAQFATTTWFPSKNSRLADASFIQDYNYRYIYYTYGPDSDKDFYFTNQEVFKGAKTMLGAIAANPIFVAKEVLRNTKRLVVNMAEFTMLPKSLCEKNPHLKYPHYLIVILFIVPLILTILYGTFRFCKTNHTLFVFFIGNVLILGTTVMSLPNTKYMFCLIPIFAFSAFWYGTYLSSTLERLSSFFPRQHWAFLAVGRLAMIIIFIFFFCGIVNNWLVIGKDLISDIKNGRVSLMQRRNFSLITSYKKIQPLIKNCTGVMAFEHWFVGAFMDIPLDKIYDIWEIPPFGYLDNSDYKGLNPERIDCILVSHNLATGIGGSTNYRLRYQNYIAPYIKQLQKMGAEVHEIEGFGQVVVLPKIK